MTIDEKPAKKRFWTPYGVLSVLIILAFILSISGGEPGHAALSVNTSNFIRQIYTACQAYQTEYGVLPETSENSRLIKILSGDNPHKIVFLSLKPRDVSPNGEMIDPWGTPFRIIFDSDSKIHVISAGPDEIFGTPDDITNE